MFFAVAQSVSAAERIRGDEPAPKFKNEPIHPVPLRVEKDVRIVALGRKLFHDTRLSRDNTVSCASCHPLDSGGMDGNRYAIGIDDTVGSINTPTVFNSGMSFVQFWDGRAATLEEQAAGPVHNPIEMGSSWDEVLPKLKADQEYVKTFARLFKEGITPKTVTGAIATFERTLVTPNARFDQFLRGDEDAINENELKGYLLFKSYGCSSCHQGVAVGGNMFEKMGVLGNYFEDRGNVTDADYGRFNVTGIEEHRFEFKVPSLRNVELTAPYFHDGLTDTLEEAVMTMAKYQLGRKMQSEDVNLIVTFLKTLTGELGQ